MNTTLKTLIAATLIAGSAGLAHAESKSGDNRQFLAQDNAQAVQTIRAQRVQEGRSATTVAPVNTQASDFGYNAGGDR